MVWYCKTRKRWKKKFLLMPLRLLNLYLSLNLFWFGFQEKQKLDTTFHTGVVSQSMTGMQFSISLAIQSLPLPTCVFVTVKVGCVCLWNNSRVVFQTLRGVSHHVVFKGYLYCQWIFLQCEVILGPISDLVHGYHFQQTSPAMTTQWNEPHFCSTSRLHCKPVLNYGLGGPYICM